jgi:hypothetical protein
MKATNTNTIEGNAGAQADAFRFKSAIERGVQRLEVQAATGSEEVARCQQWLGEEHYLGPARTVGNRLFQIVIEDGQPVAVLLWAASAWHLKDRDDWIDWDPLTRACRLKLIVSNWRFLVLEETRRPNLASQCLAAALRALPGQWEARYGYRPLLAESFTDPESHAGTCYKASGWQPLGMSKGFARQRCEFYVPNDRPKKLWVRELAPNASSLLCARKLPAAHAAGETDGGGVRSVLKAEQLRSLAQVFRQIPDPRARASMRYPLPAVLTIIAMALLGGAVHLSEICRAGQRLDRHQRTHIGLRYKKGTRFRSAPGYSVYRDLLATLDLEAMARVFNRWLGEHRGILPRSLALDGKTIVGQLGEMVSLVDEKDGVPVAILCNDDGKELPAAQKLLASEEVNLINATVNADALHCQDQSARETVTGGGDYLFRIKANQPTLEQRARSLLPVDGQTPPLFRPDPRKATGASKSVTSTPAGQKPGVSISPSRGRSLRSDGS